MFLPGLCHSCPDTKACVLQDREKQEGCTAALLSPSLSTVGFGLFHNMERGGSSLEPMTRMQLSGPASACRCLLASRCYICHHTAPVYFCPPENTLQLQHHGGTLPHTGAEGSTAQCKHSPVFSSLGPWAPTEDYGG